MSEKIAMQRHNYDVVVIGAGGAGLRAAVEARSAGLRVAIICKSLFGKAHTVMAEGGVQHQWVMSMKMMVGKCILETPCEAESF